MINWIILAAGKGSRMKSDLPKALHFVGKKRMFDIASDLIDDLSSENDTKIAVISEEMRDNYSDLLPKSKHIQYAIQKERLGNAHAIKSCLDCINPLNKKTIIIYVDTPFLKKETVSNISNALDYYDCVNIAFVKKENNRYGKMILKDKTIDCDNLKIGDIVEVLAIKEEKLFEENEVRPIVCHGGMICFRTNFLLKHINDVEKNSIANEYFITDMFEIANKNNYKTSSVISTENEALGINTQEELLNAVHNIKNEE